MGMEKEPVLKDDQEQIEEMVFTNLPPLTVDKKYVGVLLTEEN